jgi:hypothetical protein
MHGTVNAWNGECMERKMHGTENAWNGKCMERKMHGTVFVLHNSSNQVQVFRMMAVIAF